MPIAFRSAPRNAVRVVFFDAPESDADYRRLSLQTGESPALELVVTLVSDYGPGIDAEKFFKENKKP